MIYLMFTVACLIPQEKLDEDDLSLHRVGSANRLHLICPSRSEIEMHLLYF